MFGPGCFTFLNETIPVTLTGSTLLTTSPANTWYLYWTVGQDLVGNSTSLYGLQLSSYIPQAPIVVPPPPVTTAQAPPLVTTGQVPPPSTTGKVPPPSTTGQIPPPPATTSQVPFCPATGQPFTTQEVQQSAGSLTSVLSPILMLLCSTAFFMH